MILLSAFAVIAVFLAVVGIYGVVSWGVVQRTREMGIGCFTTRRNVVGSTSMQPTGVCRCIAWAVGSLALTRAVGASLSEVGPGKTPLLFGVKALDPITFIVAPILLAVVALLACCLPARRATKIDPLVALRYE
jgi:putative ABC transport system permease protein